jgi:tetratricopeptide (TPR) repeat protein
MRRRHVIVVLLTLTIAPTAAWAREPSFGPLPVRPDADLWARRNLELLRTGVKGPPDPPSPLVAFSIATTPVLMRPPYDAEVLRLAQASRQQTTDADARQRWDHIIELLSLPADKRKLRQRGGNLLRADSPLSSPEAIYNLTSDLCNLRPEEAYDAAAPHAIERIESAARAGGMWEALGQTYFTLARTALIRGRADRANEYCDRLLIVLREHPSFQDPRRGNTGAVRASAVAELLWDLHRWRDGDLLAAQLPTEAKAEFGIGRACELARRGDFTTARNVIAREVRPSDEQAASRLAAAVDGSLVAPTSAGATTAPATAEAVGPRTLAPRTAAESRLREAEAAIAHAHVRRGDVETAGRMLIQLQQAVDTYTPAGTDDLAAHVWAGLAYDAEQGDHPEAAPRALSRAVAALSRETYLEPEQREETARFVRESLAVGDFELARSLLTTTLPPGPRARYQLSKAYRANGDIARADALREEALRVSPGHTGGSVMAEIAVELHAAGDRARAESIFLNAFAHIHGEDFGFGGTTDIVRAACQMQRLDLLDRLYNTNPEARLLLCIVACRCADER